MTTPIQYRQSATGLLYRRCEGVNEVQVPWGWTLATFFLGASGWQAIQRFTQPTAGGEVTP